MNVLAKPEIIRTINKQVAFLVAMWLLSLIGIVGVWYVWGAYVGIAALIFRIIFKPFVFRLYYKQELRRVLTNLLPEDTDSMAAEDNQEVLANAYLIAAQQVNKNRQCQF